MASLRADNLVTGEHRHAMTIRGQAVKTIAQREMTQGRRGQRRSWKDKLRPIGNCDRVCGGGKSGKVNVRNQSSTETQKMVNDHGSFP